MRLLVAVLLVAVQGTGQAHAAANVLFLVAGAQRVCDACIV